MKKTIAILDYGCGNLASLGNALARIKVNFSFLKHPEKLRDYDAFILPGVGAFAHGITELEKSGLNLALMEELQKGKDVLGICLGMQLLFSRSTEGGTHLGLDLINGTVQKIGTIEKVRIPHMGWNDLTFDSLGKISLFEGIPSDCSYYFVHSFCASSNENVPKAYARYGDSQLLAAFEAGNVKGVQFHPEKSHDAGLKLLNNYCFSK